MPRKGKGRGRGRGRGQSNISSTDHVPDSEHQVRGAAGHATTHVATPAPQQHVDGSAEQDDLASNMAALQMQRLEVEVTATGTGKSDKSQTSKLTDVPASKGQMVGAGRKKGRGRGMKQAGGSAAYVPVTEDKMRGAIGHTPKPIVSPAPQHPVGGLAGKEDLAPSVAGLDIEPPEAGATGVSKKDQDKQEKRMNVIPFRKLPNRPDDGGKLGKTISVLANHFPVKLNLSTLYHYDVEITNQKHATVPRKIKWALFQQATKTDSNLKHALNGCRIGFDGEKNMYSTKRLIDKKIVVTTDYYEEGGDPQLSKCYNIAIKPTLPCEVDLTAIQLYHEGKLPDIPQETVLGLDIILRHLPNLRYVPRGKSFFFPGNGSGAVDLGDGVEMWRGGHTSFRHSRGWLLTLNMDIKSAPFYKKQPVIDYIKQKFPRLNIDSGRLNQFQIKELQSTLRNVKISCCHYNGYVRKFAVKGVTRESLNELRFKDDSGSSVTVTDYFRKTYNINLKYRNLPCLKVGQKSNFMPVELCEIVEGQYYNNKLGENQTRNMIKKTAVSPTERQKDIEETLANRVLTDSDSFKDIFVISKTMPQIEARVIPAPDMQIKDKKMKNTVSVRTKDGTWDMRNNKFLVPATIKTWAGVTFEPRVNLSQFCNSLGGKAYNLGLTIGPPNELCIPPRRIDDRNLEEIEPLFERIKRKFPDLQLLVVVLPAGANFVYGEVKRVAETKLGIMTQCVQEKNIRPGPKLQQTLGNICLKINQKLKGTNARWAMNNNPTNNIPETFLNPDSVILVLGADVTHPAPGESSVRPSIAAVVGSTDRFSTQYIARTTVQNRRMEMITGFKGHSREMLLKFYQISNGRKPNIILYYRDGVSEGQFQKVLYYELQSLQEACSSFESDYKPAITVIIVQKRHNTRLFPDPKDRNSAAPTRSRNVPAGTVVDRAITHPTQFDFFLCSHQGIQGTSKPTHYHVLYDDNEFSSDELQKITYYLCYHYARCTRSVSIPAPVYYAHHVAFRAREYLNNLSAASDTRSQVSSSSEESLSSERLSQLQEQITLTEEMAYTSYFL